jgi:poly-gamma-glutamate capsule biosynthesis protein CapA/YwtB (metallophosphatase superfamily)
LPDFGEVTVGRIADQVAHVKQPGDVIIASIHWGPNWGYEIPEEHRNFAHALIDQAHVSVIHGHSSHHPKAIEIYKNQPILYGCGDFLNDYEGISGYEEFRGDLTLMYFADFNSLTEHLIDLELAPLQMRRFQLVPASGADILWLRRTLDRESVRFGTHIRLKPDGRLTASRLEAVC